MKVVILGNTNLNYSWFVRTFTQGLILNDIDVVHINYRTTGLDKLNKAITHLRPDVIITHLTFHNIKIYPIDRILGLFKDFRRKYNIKIIHILGDARTEPRYNKCINESFDFVLMNQTENLEKFRNYWKVPVYFCPYSSLTYDNTGIYHKNIDFGKPIFTGSNSHKNRCNFIKRLKEKIQIQIFKTQSKDDKRNQTLGLSVSNKCILALCTGYDIKHFMDVRFFQYLGAGACVVGRTFKGMDDIIPRHLYYPIDDYSDVSVEKVVGYWEMLKTKDTSRMRINTFNFIQKYHSSKKRMKDLIEIIEGKRNKFDVFLK